MGVSTGVVSARTDRALIRVTQPRLKSCASIISSVAKTQVVKAREEIMPSLTALVAFTLVVVASKFSKVEKSKKA